MLSLALACSSITLAPSSPPKLETTVDVRSRFERRLDRDFDPDVADNRSELLQRARVALRATFDPRLEGTLEYQFTHTLSWTPARNFSDESSDLYQAKLTGRAGPAKITLGRQTLVWGTGRLFSSSNWGQLGRSFDGAHVRSGAFEGFAGRLGVSSGRSKNARIVALAGDSRAGKTSLLYKHDSVAGDDVDIYTASHSAARNLGAWDVEGEVALQFGRDAGRDVRAWAYYARASRPLDPTTRFWCEWNVASGGGDTQTKRTFDHVYASNHHLYGSLDLHSWRNMNMLEVGLERRVAPGHTLWLRAATSSLRDASDSWYGSGGSANRRTGGTFRDPSGASGRDLGREIGLEWTWQARPDCRVQAGYGVFLPGGFVRSLSGHSTPQHFAFVQLSARR